MSILLQQAGKVHSKYRQQINVLYHICTHQELKIDSNQSASLLIKNNELYYEIFKYNK